MFLGFILQVGGGESCEELHRLNVWRHCLRRREKSHGVSFLEDWGFGIIVEGLEWRR